MASAISGSWYILKILFKIEKEKSTQRVRKDWDQ
jgi:hypothetical protein